MQGLSETNERRMRAYAIISKGDKPEVIGNDVYLMPSQSEKGAKYKVECLNETFWTCNCMDYKTRAFRCKHIFSVIFWLDLKEKVEAHHIELTKPLFEKPTCVFCQSFKVMKHGTRKCDTMTKQRYLCKDCNRTFIEDQFFKKFKGDAKTITLVMDLYFKGISLRKIQDHLKQFYNLDVNHVTIRRWILRFIGEINDYVATLNPEVSKVWHADEMVVKSKGKNIWIWNVLDEKTRFLLANNVTNGRDIDEARQVFRKTRMVAKRPQTMITDGLHSYPKAIKKELFKTEHIRYESIRSDPHNNKIERFHGTLRERDKILRGWKGNKNAQTWLDGYRTYYNFIRPHMSLMGLTPSQVAEINLSLGNNKWLGLIKLTKRLPTDIKHL